MFEVSQVEELFCRFLGIEVPDEPSLHLNEAGAMRQVLEELITAGESPAVFRSSDPAGPAVHDRMQRGLVGGVAGPDASSPSHSFP
ncbi:hypothetical protein [Nonomuraea sp. MG754425]|uniref:hypothetical protein n=1 Tax=Nonomuraea sp. MG754425 TaxID=2570319 RepID=UPI0027E1F50E|nr:hypothetical protein [Nonomuraea sp. MG754425]